MTRDSDVLEFLTDQNTLLDAKLIGFSFERVVGTSGSVELSFEGRVGSDYSKITIRFTEIIAYNISYECIDGYIDIWDYKFIELADKSFYISLDPDPWTLPSAGATVLQPSATDHFFIHARSIEAILVP